MYKTWSDKDIEFLRTNYPLNGTRYCCINLNRNRNSINSQARKLKIKLINHISKKWTDEEIKFLKFNYPTKGLKYCHLFLNRSSMSVDAKKQELGLKSKTWDYNKQKRIISRISEKKIIAKCNIHGDVMHYDRDTFRCSLCSLERTKKWNKTDIGRASARRRNYMYRKNERVNFISRVRARLKGCFNGKSIHFKDLGYSGDELRNHISLIKQKQNNCCPICFSNYDQVGFCIEHLIPIDKAKSKEEIINLFQLSNLWTMCGICNSSKGKRNFDEWHNKNITLKKG